MAKKICHITTVHPKFDARIFHKECKSLSKAGYEVHLIVQNDNNEIIDGIFIHALPKSKNRKERMIKLRKIALKKAIEINADVYHLHDPELIPIGLKLKELGKKLIFDSHEDVPMQMLSKPYLNKFLLKIIAFLLKFYEKYSCKRFDYIVAATPYIRDKFLKINKNSIDINNYPLMNELYNPINWNDKKNEICYIGGITKIRGIIELIKALEYTCTTLHLAGNFESKKLEEEVKSLEGWKKVKYYGFVNRNKVREILSKVKIGLVTLHPIQNYLYSLPIKIFEYMSAGIPVIASNFSLWKEIVEKNNCGLCVDPLNPKKIADAINYLLKNDPIASKMGKNARNLIETKFNWEKEKEKLINVYNEVLAK